MLLNRLEYLLMNNPVRAAIQRHVEARRLLQLGGSLEGATVLEIGCGRGVGAEVILDRFGAAAVHGFDLDPRMVALARRRLAPFGPRVRLWVGDATAIAAPDARYDAVFDFGILHHVPDWRRALGEVERVLQPGGKFYAEEVLARWLHNPLARRLFVHPLADRFDQPEFLDALRTARLQPTASRDVFGSFAWFIARKAARSPVALVK